MAYRYKLSSRSGPISIEDYRALAKRSLPDGVWSFIEYGAEDLVTLAENRSAFDRYALRMKVLTGNSADDLSAKVGGQQLSMPIVLAPAGLVALSHWTGEVGAARAAENAGTLSMLSTTGSYTIEEVAEGTRRNHFFQLYPWADPSGGRHDLTHALMERARRSGYSALVVTVDVSIHGNREVERRRGIGQPPIITPARIAGMALRPAWWTALLRYKRFTSRTVEPTVGAGATVGLPNRIMRSELTWEDFSWIREHWHGPLFIKGVLDADDAERAVSLGADGVVVSNHGGRQLDGAPATLDALPAIARRVGDRAEVLLDGGIRRGSDVVKALCLGAKAVGIGRPYLYGMAVRGPAGVEHVLSILREETARVMTLMGIERLDQLGPHCLLPAHSPIQDRPARSC